MNDTNAFLAARYGDLPTDWWVEIRALRLDGKVRQRFWERDVSRLAERALALPHDLAIYCGVNPRRDGGGAKADVVAILDLFADVDDKHYTTGRAGALAALAAFPLPATLIVDSGGGLQAYWRLREPLPISGASDPLVGRVEGLQRRLYSHLGELHSLDAVQNIDRILRLPGTYNRKPEYGTPRMVTIVSYNSGATYDLADFERLLPAPTETPRSRPTSPSGVSAGRGLPSVEEVRELLAFIPPRGDYKDDWLTVLAAVHSLYPGPEGVALCEEWSPGHPGEVERKFRSFGHYRGQRGPAGVGTLYHLAKLHGWRPPVRQRLILAPIATDARPFRVVTPGEVRRAR